MKKLNHCVGLDFETGGLDPSKHGITEIGISSFRLDDFKEIIHYQAYIKPYDKVDLKKRVVKKAERPEPVRMEYEEKALEYTNISMEMLEEKGAELKLVADEAFEMVKKTNVDKGRSTKPFLVGQNIQFDIGFLQQLAAFTGHDLSKYFDGKVDFYGNFYPAYMDTLMLSRAYFATNDKVTSHKLELVADELGIELVAAHSALDDTYASNEVCQQYLRLMRSGTGDLAGEDVERVRDHFKF